MRVFPTNIREARILSTRLPGPEKYEILDSRVPRRDYLEIHSILILIIGARIKTYHLKNGKLAINMSELVVQSNIRLTNDITSLYRVNYDTNYVNVTMQTR